MNSKSYETLIDNLGLANYTEGDGNKRQYREKASVVLTVQMRRLVPAYDLVNSCISCLSFNAQTETCKKFQNMRPPAHILAFGCDKYDDQDEIPF